MANQNNLFVVIRLMLCISNSKIMIYYFLNLLYVGRGDEDDYKQYHTAHPITINQINKKTNFYKPKYKHTKKRVLITIYTLFILIGNTSATLLGRLYFDKGGKSKWMATLVQSLGFLLFIPLKFIFSPSKTTLNSPSQLKLSLLYLTFGLFLTGDNLLTSYGLIYLPVSTYSLLCASQLAFNAITSFFINAQKFTALIINSVVILTISVCLLAINSNDENNMGNYNPNGKYVLGFLCTIGASATYSLMMSLIQYSFEKLIKDESFNTIVCMQLYPSFVSSCACILGLFASGEWKTIKTEMREFKLGRAPYVMILTCTAIGWEIFSYGLLGLIFEISSLFSNVITTLALPLTPIFAVVFFHDKMNGVKIIALVLAIWGFFSYIYQHYLEEIEANKAQKQNGNEVDLDVSLEMC
ncbi:probable purine permease 11 [Amaranthus tricolor]|uniref:probable purine permease 11 n=1 Tax=Amaranthus tricolor TaxID=29722 RepID=UPI002582A891|nr:probable purine permease 11 [Amaranthus tricolor]